MKDAANHSARESVTGQATQHNLAAAHVVNGLGARHHLVPWRNFRHLLETQARVSPDKAFLIFHDQQGQRSEYSYASFTARVRRIAHYLGHELGICQGDRVATLCSNHSDTVLLYFACWWLGAAVAPQNIDEDDRRIAFILRNSEAVVCFTRPDQLQRARRLVSGDEAAGATNVRRILSTEALSTAPDPGPPVDWQAETRPGLEDEALLVYTSGTTGAPKGVVLTQYNLLVDASGISAWQGITGNQRMMCVLPVHHVNGTVVTLVTPLVTGGSTVLNAQFSVQAFWRRIVDEGVHVVSVVPTLLQYLIEQAERFRQAGHGKFGPGLSAADLRHFRHFICGAGTLALTLAREFEDCFNLTLLHGYGLSETTCYSCFLPIDLSPEDRRHWLLEHDYPSIGCPIAPNEMAIFAADGSGRQLGEGHRGEICVRGHNVMKHYYRRPDANEETFRFGWFRSGDEGFWLRDEFGRRFFFISGRIKELINRGGVKYSPLDIEEVLLELPGVRAGLAIAFPNTWYGEEVGAWVVRQHNASLDEADVLTHCRARLPFAKCPKVVVFGEDVPVTSTGKYQRLKLQDAFAAWRDEQFRESDSTQ
ncbi:MAG: class I adenylate-forming enzyme family protein [Anaerolineaceae bacterium]|nr:class I adenylate-forming enzyme family protein [Anaerolineaceae bacterium]